MSGCSTAIVPAPSAVTAPTHATTVMASGLASKNGCARQMRKMPAVTIVAAWMSAETGVGPSIASVSHGNSGTWALLPTQARNSRSAIAVTVPLDACAAAWFVVV